LRISSCSIRNWRDGSGVEVHPVGVVVGPETKLDGRRDVYSCTECPLAHRLDLTCGHRLLEVAGGALDRSEVHPPPSVRTIGCQNYRLSEPSALRDPSYNRLKFLNIHCDYLAHRD
jgi:hypothetical protein